MFYTVTEGNCVLFFSRSLMSDSLQPHGLQHSRLPCPSPSPKDWSKLCPLSWWCHPTISFSVIPFSSRLLSFYPLHQGLFQWVSSLHQEVQVLELWILWIYECIYIRRRICFPTVEAFGGDIMQHRVGIYTDLVNWVKSLGTSTIAIHPIASVTRVASWEIKTRSTEWRLTQTL